jgi:Family of unknown function (DUF6325)
MTESRHPEYIEHRVRTDLVEYLIVGVPDIGALRSVAEALADLVAAGTVRLLDLVVLVRDADGIAVGHEVESVASMAALHGMRPAGGGLLSDKDIEVASLALKPSTAGVVVVTEDRWAEPLSVAARRAGGRIVAGDRIPPRRVEAVLSDIDDDEAGA